MRPLMLRLTVTIASLVSCLAVNEGLVPNFHMSLGDEGHADAACPPCEVLFSKLASTGTDGKLTQNIKVQERGEPKSGTAVMYEWASGTLVWTCHYLQQLFGEESCHLYFTEEANDGHDIGRSANRTLIFEPALGGSDARCTCDTIDRVSIVLSRADKHTLPVDFSCAYSHRFGIQLAPVHSSGDPGLYACDFEDGTRVTNYDDVRRCMHEGSCEIVDDWLQLAIFRDPRPAVVSAFFHLQVHSDLDLGTLKDFVARELPILCQWLAVRYVLFSEVIPDQSLEVWYTDAMGDPLLWHYNWFDSIGLQLPYHVVEATAKAAAANHFGFYHKALDVHPGERARIEAGPRRFEDEVSMEVVAEAAIVLRRWLPPALLGRFGVEP